MNETGTLLRALMTLPAPAAAVAASDRASQSFQTPGKSGEAGDRRLDLRQSCLQGGFLGVVERSL